MNEQDYQMIFKRKSFHSFTGKNRLSEGELQKIKGEIGRLEPLVAGIKTEFRIVPREKTTCKRGEFCILIYSEVKEHFKQNVGYMGEQLDLWLAAQNIGACWYGMGETSEKSAEGLEFVIMIAIEKAGEEEFRKDYTKAKRKGLSEIWMGDQHEKVGSALRYAPSACNSQPWLVRCEGDRLRVYQVRGKRGIMPRAKVAYYNTIDIGIFLLFLDVCLGHEGIAFIRKLSQEAPVDQDEREVAVYTLKPLAE